MEDEGRAKYQDETAFNRSLAPLGELLLRIERTSSRIQTILTYSDSKIRLAFLVGGKKYPFFSFIFGIPPKEILDECRAKRHRDDWHGHDTR